MRPKTSKLDRKHPQATRDAIEDINEINRDPKPTHNDVRYMEPNRDRALGEADRTGRHFDEDAGEVADAGTRASKKHEAD
jgi:hypothetical protein